MNEQPLQSSPQKEFIPMAVSTESVLPRHRSYFHRKSIVPVIFMTLLLAGGLGIGLTSMGKSQQIRSKATNNGSTLMTTPNSKTLDLDQTTSIGIILNTHDDSVSAVEVHLTYDKTAVQITGFTAGTMFPVILKPATFTNGAIDTVVGVLPTTPFKGVGILGTITIKVLSQKTSSIAFVNTTQVAAIGKTNNALISTKGSTIIGTSINVTNTPTPTDISEATNTPIPTRLPGATGTPTRTSTPRASNTTTPVQGNTIPILTIGASDTPSVSTIEDYSPFGSMKVTAQKTNLFNQIFNSIMEFFRKLL